MKKLLIVLLALMMLCGTCLAESGDYASMSDEELHAVVDAARNELAKRELAVTADTVLIDQDGIKVYLNGQFEMDSVEMEDYRFLRVDVVVVNDSEKNVNVSIDSACINGWEVYGDGVPSISAGKKKKGELSFNAASADVKTVEEIEDIEIRFSLSDGDTYMTFAELEPITLHFNQQ